MSLASHAGGRSASNLIGRTLITPGRRKSEPSTDDQVDLAGSGGSFACPWPLMQEAGLHPIESDEHVIHPTGASSSQAPTIRSAHAVDSGDKGQGEDQRPRVASTPGLPFSWCGLVPVVLAISNCVRCVRRRRATSGAVSVFTVTMQTGMSHGDGPVSHHLRVLRAFLCTLFTRIYPLLNFHRSDGPVSRQLGAVHFEDVRVPRCLQQAGPSVHQPTTLL